MRHSIVFINIVRQLADPERRTAKFLSFVKGLLKPLQTLNNVLIPLVQQTRIKAGFSGQVMYIEKALNLQFDSVLERIYIEDGPLNQFPPYIYRKIENTPLYLYNRSENTPTYIYNRAEYNNPIHFIVKVPAHLMSSTTEIRALVNSLKQAGKNYDIQTI